MKIYIKFRNVLNIISSVIGAKYIVIILINSHSCSLHSWEDNVGLPVNEWFKEEPVKLGPSKLKTLM